MPPKSPHSLLTDAELELMLILWELGEGSVHAVLEQLPSNRNMAYTTASTIIRILEKKGFVESRKDGKAHIYIPRINRETYESRTLGHVVGKLFDKSPAALVARLLDDTTLSPAEIAELRKLLEERG